MVDPGRRTTTAIDLPAPNWRWLRFSAGLVVATACFVWGLPTFASYRMVGREVGPRLQELSPTLGTMLAVVASANLVAPSLVQMAALPGLSLRRAVWVDWATTATASLVPGGSPLAVGLTWSMYRSFGLESPAVARSMVVTGMGDALVKLGSPLLALIWLSTQRPVSPTLVQAAVLGTAMFVVALVVFAVLLAGSGVASAVGRWLDRVPLLPDGWSDRLNRLRADTISLLAQRGWRLGLWTVLGHANLYFLLVLCLRVVGVERSVLGWAPVLAAFAFGRLVTALPLTPGGLGVMELGLTGALSTVGSASSSSLVAAVLIFRLLSFALPLPLGLTGLLWWQWKPPD